jgi:hypothetical protein
VLAATALRLPRANVASLFIPRPGDPTGTVTFISFEGRTYAVTAGHIIDIFRENAEKEGAEPEAYFLPAAPGLLLQPPLVRPAAPWTAPMPDIALRPIPTALPARIGKQAFAFSREPSPIFPIPFALAVGFPSKSKRTVEGGRIALPCVHAVAEGVGSSSNSDQIQFWSELSEWPPTESLSGLSGGPIFWSDGGSFGLLGFVKQALDLRSREGEDTIYDEPRVNFICQRASYETFAEWAAYAEETFPKERAKLNERVSGGA